jgi:hypothetical protein
MGRTKIVLAATATLALLLFPFTPSWSQVEIGDFTISGEAEVGGMPMRKEGHEAKFEEYRDLPETLVVPQLQLMFGS